LFSIIEINNSLIEKVVHSAPEGGTLSCGLVVHHLRRTQHWLFTL